MSTPASHFFISYSRENAELQRRVITELRSRGIKVWVDVENLIPGSPAWEREIERSIREASGIIVLMSPDSHNSEWVRREISFAEQNKKRIFPVLIAGDEHDSIPLRLSSHQRVDLRQNFDHGMDELANALHEHLGSTKVIKRKKQQTTGPVPADLRKFVLLGLLALVGIACIGGLALAARFLYSSINNPGSPTVTPTPSVEPFVLATAAETNTNEQLSGLIVYTCQINKQNTSDQICVINADGSGQRQLTDSGDNQDASFSPLGGTIIFVSNRSGSYEIYETDLSGHTSQLTRLGSRLSLPAISPDNQQIVFSNRINGEDQIWLMDRDGGNAELLFKSDGNMAVAPTWSPDGKQILFAVGKELARQLFVMSPEGGEPRLLSDKIITPGRTDWSSQGLIAYFIGDIWKREVWTMFPDGSGMTQVTDGENAQSPSFSPDGRFITYTAYTRIQQQDEFSCEIFIMNLSSHEKRQLTDNDICDYQPRWGK